MEKASSAALRRRRRKLVRDLPSIEQIVRGSLIETYKRCGRPSCHCIDGPGHGPKRYLSTIARTGERPRLGYVPNAIYPKVAEFLGNYRTLQEMLNEICAINAELLRRRESLD
ncbi:DUF6788 family protein [Bradyrhizobium sp. CCGUVB23]|uniref:DUF6788 family protein n=1 Tax=Bradyrhizobium sp. CCGUVB23 TaxID=2949630 RepID=UPI003531A0A8